MTSLTILSIFAILNIISFVLMALDKFYAVKRKWRISEMSLMLISLFGGGSIGTMIGMVVCKHKTSKSKFRYGGVPIIILLQWGGGCIWLSNLDVLTCQFKCFVRSGGVNEIRTRLMLFAVVIAILIGGVGYYGISGLQFVNQSMETIYETNLSNIQSLSGVRESYLRIQISLFKLATNQSETVRSSLIRNDLTPALDT